MKLAPSMAKATVFIDTTKEAKSMATIAANNNITMISCSGNYLGKRVARCLPISTAAAWVNHGNDRDTDNPALIRRRWRKADLMESAVHADDRAFPYPVSLWIRFTRLRYS